MRRYGLALGLLATSCGFRYEATAPGNPVEEALLSETARAAGAIGVRVRGEITDTISPAQLSPGVPAPTAWYSGGVAWFYRPMIAKYVSIDPEPGRETARNVATHEVCHAVSYHHDLAHWECMNTYAVPTYPRPVAADSASAQELRANFSRMICLAGDDE